MKFSFILSLLSLTLWAAAGESYSFYLLSDMHFGAADTYHPQRFRGNRQRADMALPAYKKMFQHMVKNAGDTRFVIQLGDLIEGNARDEKNHAKQLTDAITLLNESFPFPVYHVRGNHDSFGLGGKEAAQAVLLPAIAKSVNKEKLPNANYSFTCGPDLFIVADYIKSAKGTDFIRQTLKAQKKKPRYVFIAVHCPVIALVTPDFADELAQYNAIVLSGHIHRNYLLQYTKNGKTMTQIHMSSWLPAKNWNRQRAAMSSQDKKFFKEFMLSQAKKFKKLSFMSVYEKEWEPYLSFSQYRGNGYLKISVSDAGLTLLRQGADTTSKPVTTTVDPNKK